MSPRDKHSTPGPHAGVRGFTLAELLIVLAVIAILTAVAIPVFTGEVDRAKEAVEAANIRAIRAAAVSAILSEGIESDTGWLATAHIDSLGNITYFKVEPMVGKLDDNLRDGHLAYHHGDETYYLLYIRPLNI